MVGTQTKRWELASPIPNTAREKLQAYHSIMAQVLYNRGLIEPAVVQAFLENRYLESEDPFLLPDMQLAVDRIKQAVEKGETIVVYGDFDADGVTSSVLLTEALRGLGLERGQARPYIPDRIREGYGLNNDALTHIRSEIGATLVITVDCGIRSVAEVEHANSIGLDIIITDHHGLGPALPPAVAIINPKRPESQYPERMLAGVGIAFKLAQALKQTMPDRATFSEESLLDLVAVGTVADIAPLKGENRLLVTKGLVVLNKAERPGIDALLRAARLRPGQLTAESIGFGLGPRINAAGRLAHAYSAAKLLAAPSIMHASPLAMELEQLNQKRRKLTADLSQYAADMVDPDAPIIIAHGDRFPQGIVGLVASRLADKHFRPAIILEEGETFSRGSCRSIPGFHITNALDQVADLLVKYGGHSQAAGLTIANENIPAFRERLTVIATAQLAGMDLTPTITIDAVIPLAEIDWALHESLQQLEPTGEANRSPIFCTYGAQVNSFRTVGQDGAHLQMELEDGRFSFKSIAFRMGEWAEILPAKIDAVFSLNVNEWNGQRTLQLQIIDLRLHQPQT